MLHLDGSYQEGGGQLLRTALALATLTRTPFRIEKIRHNRSQPGLKNQHLACINALKQLSNAEVKGARLGSPAIEFFPGKVAHSRLTLDIGTAGSITLLLQSLLLPCLFADHNVRLKIKGGTDTKWSIPMDYFTHVIRPLFSPFARIEIGAMQRGFYPRGQGLVDLTIKPGDSLDDHENFEALVTHVRQHHSRWCLTAKTELTKVEGISCASEQLRAAQVAERQAEGAARKLRQRGPVKIETEYCRTASPGTVITLWITNQDRRVLVGADALGTKGKPAEAVGAAAAEKLLKIINSDAAVDHHLADNLIPLLALTRGIIRTDQITGHIRSNIYVCEKFLNVSFRVDERNKLLEAV
ncbi:MAG: RNA 3'-terminal phosphate cyclase [Desulfobacterales bacterium]|nr:MAG: RNA 3'-terminal phosphate cyclase [Desulfobacterales bacterium]